MTLSNLGKVNFDNRPLLLMGAVVSFFVAVGFHSTYKRPELVVSKQESAININTLFLKMLSLGNKRLIADTLWIQTLIESDLETYQGDPFNNWMYLRFKNISELDPPFYENYLFGGQYLSIIKNDLQGAAEIMERGLKLYPDDYRLNFNQGFNYYFEMGDAEKGIFYLDKIKDHPKAPSILTSLVIKLRHQLSHDPAVTLRMLKEAYDQAEDQNLKNKLESDIYALKAEIDLTCLNSGKSSCERKDAYGETYRLENGQYKARREYRPYKLFRHKK